MLPSVSYSTMPQQLREEGLRMWQKQKRPYFTLEQAHIWLLWALDHEDWIEEDWMKVL